MNRHQSPNFQSLYGFKELTIKQENLFLRLKEIIDWTEIIGYNAYARKEYAKIRLLDTFFSDSFPKKLMRQILNNQSKHNYEIEILIINPYSPIADSRAKALNLNQFLETNIALNTIRKAIYSIEKGTDPLSKIYQKESKSIEFIFSQLEDLNKFKAKYGLEIKFYDVLTDVPIFIISQFVVKGQILYNKSAAENPWMIFVDDINQDNDLYDSLSENFDDIWKISSLLPSKVKTVIQPNKNIFLSRGRNAAIKTVIEKYIKNQKYNPVLFEYDSYKGDTIIENLERITSKCGSAIILLTKEDFLIDNKVRARQNVIHELGWCQALYGRKQVLILVEENTEVPSNIEGVYHEKFNTSNIEKLENVIQKFLSKK